MDHSLKSQEINELEMIFKQSLNEIFVADGNGVCIQANPACEENFGIPASELIGMNVYDLVEKGIFYPSATLKVLEEKKPITLIQSTAQGKRLYAVATPVFENEQVSRVISTTIDITEVLSLKRKIKEMEELIDNYNKEIKKLKTDKWHQNGKIVVKSRSMQRIFELLQLVATVDSTVLLLGETGVGKTEIAKWIHHASSRQEKHFAEINCAAIPATLFESELFGYEPGSFSGASPSGSEGLIGSAEGGTLFLDEIGELPLNLQTKILQLIQNKTYRKIGSKQLNTADVRIISATNQNLENLVKAGKFREDLYYRLSVVPITIPPLRNRPEDLIKLIHMILNEFNETYQTNKVFSAQTMETLVSHQWPGNIRELKNTIERMFVTTRGMKIDKTLDFLNLTSLNDFKELTTTEYTNDTELTILSKALSVEEDLSLNERLDMIEKEILERFQHKYKTTRQVAKQLHSSQSTISRKILKYNDSD